MLTESRPGRWLNDHQLRPGDGHRFHQAVYEPGHQHSIQGKSPPDSQ